MGPKLGYLEPQLLAHTIPLVFGYPVLGLGSCNRKVGYPQKGVLYELTGRGSWHSGILYIYPFCTINQMANTAYFGP